jgi:hypothetical protein
MYCAKKTDEIIDSGASFACFSPSKEWQPECNAVTESKNLNNGTGTTIDKSMNELDSMRQCNKMTEMTYHLNNAIVGPSIFWEYQEFLVGIDKMTNEKQYKATPIACTNCKYTPLPTSIVTDGHDMATGAMQVQLGWFPNKEIRQSGAFLRGAVPSEIEKKETYTIGKLYNYFN